jgi:hypothetical protein
MDNRQPQSSLGGPSRSWPKVLAVFLLGALAVGGWYAYQMKNAPTPVAPIAEAPPPDAGIVEEEPIPPLPAPEVVTAQGQDALKGLSEDPEYQRWLGETDLLSRLVAAMSRIAEGESPRMVLSFLAPTGAFEVVEKDKVLVIAPQSCARYDKLAQTLDTLDVAKAAAAYQTLRPLLAGLHKQIAKPGATLDATLNRALTRLIDTPVPSTDVEVVPGAGNEYDYADPALEKLSNAQKHLLRMCPKNARLIQGKAAALKGQLGLQR